MKKLLLIGVDTRSMLKSALNLNYEVYSASYFSTSDTPTISRQKIILKEEYGESCGNFEENFNSSDIIEISKDFIDEVDYIIPISGVSPSDFSKKDRKKILGNKNVEDIENKFRFYKKIKNEFTTPKSFCISDIDEAYEINENYPESRFILKPIQGSGGYGVFILNNQKDIELNDDKFIMQEYINGVNLSSSILASRNDAKTVINSRLLTVNDFENNGNYTYAGNILPLTNESMINRTCDIDCVNEELSATSEKLAKKFRLLGSNGVDYILNEKGLYVIELNPRIQGTFECVEQSLGINMLDAHIKSCFGEIINIPQAEYYSYKKIIYAKKRINYQKIYLDNIYDLPHIGSITEKNEPLLTIIDKDEDLEKLYKKIEKSNKIINTTFKIDQQDAL